MISGTMKAAVRESYGNPDILSVREIDIPVPKENEVLVKVHVTTVNRTDGGVITGLPYVFRLFTGPFKPYSKITGTDVAGEVVAVGARVKSFGVGDRIFGFHDEGRLGSHAQYMVSEEKHLHKIPEGISFRDAVASAEAAHYALNFINKVKLNPGDRVLVNGATGAIGSAAIQLLKNIGAHVTAVGPGLHLDKVWQLGPDEVIDFTREDFTQTNQRFHFVFDAVGKSTWSKCKPLLLPKGVYISSELGPRGENPFLALITPLGGGKRVLFPFPSNIPRSLKQMAELLSQGKFKPLIDRTYSFDEIVEAHHYALSGEKIGNVIVEMWKAPSTHNK